MDIRVSKDRLFYYLDKLIDEDSHFYGEIRLRISDGKLIKVNSDESIDLRLFEERGKLEDE